MGQFVDLTGRRFGRLSVLKRDKNRGRRVTWLCQCKCGTRKLFVTDYLTSKGYRSCGCLRNEKTRERATTHGDTRGRRATKEYRAWSNMKGRCYNPYDRRYSNCGGQGVKVHHRWRNSFSSFLRDMGRAPRSAILRRHDIDRDFASDNCFWQIVLKTGRKRIIHKRKAPPERGKF